MVYVTKIKRDKQMMLKQKGFTLMELMIVIAIIGILVSVAYPSYQDHVRKTNRSDCHAALLQVSDLQERYYLQKNTYAPDIVTLMGAGTHQSPHEICTMTATGDVNGFVITATGGTNQVGASCTTMTINQAGSKGPAGCW